MFSQSTRVLFFSSLAATVFLGGLGAAEAETLRMGGTGSGLALLRKLGDAYMSEHPDVIVEIVGSLGTSGGLKALGDGAIDVAVSSRAPKPEEAAKGIKEVASARTPFVLVTSRQDPEPFKAADVASVFDAAEPTWSNGEPIRIILRPESETDSRLLQELFPGMPEALQRARTRPEIPVEATDQDNAETAERLKGSLTGATLVQIVTEDRKLWPLSIDGVEPTLANFEAGRYPYAKTLHFVISESPSPAAKGFAELLSSKAAAELMRKSGILPEGRSIAR